MRYGTTIFADSTVATCTAQGTRSRSYQAAGHRAAQLANALRGLGIDGDQRVATFMWNNAEHLEAYLAVPSMGAVLHTLNIRLSADQLTFIANHAADEVVIADATLAPLLATVLPAMETVRHVIVSDPSSQTAAAAAEQLAGAGLPVHVYDDLLAAEPESFSWPVLDERDAAAMCYTSGTTGNPKGVVYSHRSAYLHAMAMCAGNAFGVCRGRPCAAGGADVPRQRLGPGLCGRHGGRGPDHAGPVPAARAADAADRQRTGHAGRWGPDDL